MPILPPDEARSIAHSANPLFHLNPDAVFVIADSGYLEQVNASFVSLLLYDVQTAREFAFDRLIAPAQRKLAAAWLRSALEGQPQNHYATFIRADGSSLDVSLTLLPMQPTADGRAAGAFGIARDISAQMSAEQALSESVLRFHQVVDNLDAVFWLRDVASNQFLYVSPAFETVWRQPLNAVYENPEVFFSTIHPEDRVLVRRWMDQPPTNAVETEFRLMLPDDEERWMWARMFPIYSAEGVARTSGIVHDITERKMVEALLQESEQFARATVDALPAQIAILNAEGIIIATNKAWRDFLERFGDPTIEAAEGTNYLDVCDRVTGEDALYAHAVAAGIRAVISGERRQFAMEYPSVTPHDDFWYIVRATPFTPDRPGHVVVSHENITERKRAEQMEHEQRVLAEALRDSAASLSSTLDPKELVQNILVQVNRVVPHDSAFIALVDGETATVVAHRGYGRYAPDETFKVSERPHLSWVLRSRRPLIVDSSSDHLGLLEAQASWIRSNITAPLIYGDHVIGFLNLDSGQINAFNSEHVEHLTLFAAQASIAIENARLYDAMRMHAQEMQARMVERTSQLFRAKEHVEAILNNSSEAVILTTSNGTVMQTNPAFNQLFGYSSDEMFDKPLMMLFAPEDHAALQNALAALIETNAPRRVELRALKRDGQVFHAELALAPLVDYTGRNIDIICSLHDISKHIQAEQDLRRALDKEKELNELKSRFVSTVSHEFRTPLAVILSSLGLLRNYSDRMTPEKKSSLFDQIEGQVQHLTAMIEDVLTITRSETVGIKLDLEPIAFRAFCQELVEQIQTSDGGKHQIVLEAAPDTPDTLTADAKSLRQVLMNLLSNAVKYSPSGSMVTLELGRDGDYVRIVVRDQGIGIPPEDLPRLFEAFQRAKNALSISGTGLGLSIVKRAVEAHQGSISVHSEMGVGTTFTVRLPILPPQ